MDDRYFMGIALEEAKLAYSRGDLPVGAALAIDGKLIGRAGNTANTRNDWVSHAEYSVLYQFSSAIKKNRSGNSVLYTTWEPCLMCMGCSVFSRVSEIVYACPDFKGGVGSINPKDLNLGEWYIKKWPVVREGPLREESFGLLEKFMSENEDIWGDFLDDFRRKMKMQLK